MLHTACTDFEILMRIDSVNADTLYTHLYVHKKGKITNAFDR